MISDIDGSRSRQVLRALWTARAYAAMRRSNIAVAGSHMLDYYATIEVSRRPGESDASFRARLLAEDAK